MEIQGYNLPEDLHYEKNHYWVKVEGDILVMGMDDFAQQMAGDIVFVQIPFSGKKLKFGKKFAQVESHLTEFFGQDHIEPRVAHTLRQTQGSLCDREGLPVAPLLAEGTRIALQCAGFAQTVAS